MKTYEYSTNPCPQWCIREHDDCDHPDDRYHESAEAVLVSIFAARDHAAGPGQWDYEAGQLSIVTSQYVDSAGLEVVTFIGRAEGQDQSIMIPLECVARLGAALTEHVKMIRAT